MTNLILSDMDGTLTKGSIVLDHAGHLIKKGLIVDDGSYGAWKQDVKNERLIVAVAENYRHQLQGKSIEDLDVENFIMNELANRNNWYSALEEILIERDKGSEVVIISGSSDFLVKEVARQLDVKGEGSKYLVGEDGKLTGEVIGMFGDNAKDEYIKNNYDLASYDLVKGYGDTFADSGIFKHCEYNVLVDPNLETLEKLLVSGIKIDEILKK